MSKTRVLHGTIDIRSTNSSVWFHAESPGSYGTRATIDFPITPAEAIILSHALVKAASEVLGISPEKPCRGTNSNICVAEGCFGESCIKKEQQ